MTRRPDHEIEPLFVERWSPRAFSAEPIPQATLARCFEAARWAPSEFNLQPWRFLYARRATPPWNGFLSLLNAWNATWAANAAALIVVVSDTVLVKNGTTQPIAAHSFDAGAAWSNFAHQAHLLGWHTHAIGGFDRDAARELLEIPNRFAIDTMAAIGRLAPPETLPPDLAAREVPSGRRPVAETAIEGRFRF